MVVNLAEYRANRKEWTQGELRELGGFLRELRKLDDSYALVHIETDEEAPVAVFVPGERDATHSVTKERGGFVMWCDSGRGDKRAIGLRALLDDVIG